MKIKYRNLIIGILVLVFSSISLAEEQDYLQYAKGLSKAFEHSAKIITPSLVNISSLKKVQVGVGFNQDPRLELFKEFFGDEMFRRHFQLPPQGGRSSKPQREKERFMPNGLGSGFIWDKSGYIITNNHVVEGADQVKVKLQDKKEYTAKIVGTDPQTDIAVLKISADNITPVKIGDSESLSVGEWVIAAGSPFGLDRTITAGIVSAKGRAVSRGEQYEDFIQTDAAINVGNSGGPLINLDGEVVGINTMILSRTGGSHGIGFAIPISMAKRIAEQLINNGQVERGWLGIAIQDMSDDLRKSFNYEGDGVLIGDVNSGSPAEKAGLQSGDIVVELDGKLTTSANDFRNQIANTAPGSSVTLKLLQAGHTREVVVILGKKSANHDSEAIFDNELQGGSVIETVGFEIMDLKDLPSRNKYVGSKGKVIITSVENLSIAENVGLQAGDIILKMNDIDVNSAIHLKGLLKEADLNSGVRLLVETEGMKRFVILKK